MARTPQFKIYRGTEYVAAVKYAEDAAALIGIHGSGTVMHERRIVWREGREDVSAGESYDAAANIMRERIERHRVEAYDRVYGQGAAAKVLSQDKEGHTT